MKKVLLILLSLGIAKNSIFAGKSKKKPQSSSSSSSSSSHASSSSSSSSSSYSSSLIQLSYLESLSPEILQNNIFPKLEIKDLLSLYKTSKLLRENIKTYLMHNKLNSNEVSFLNNQLSDMVKENNFEATRDLIEIGANIKAQNFEIKMLLHVATLGGNKNIVELLIDNGSIVDMQNNNNETPLHIAAEKGYKNIVKLLIDKGADPTIESINGTPSQIAGKKIKIKVKKFSKYTVTDENFYKIKKLLEEAEEAEEAKKPVDENEKYKNYFN